MVVSLMYGNILRITRQCTFFLKTARMFIVIPSKTTTNCVVEQHLKIEETQKCSKAAFILFCSNSYKVLIFWFPNHFFDWYIIRTCYVFAGALYWLWMQKGYDRYDQIMQGDRADIDKMVLRKQNSERKWLVYRKNLLFGLFHEIRSFIIPYKIYNLSIYNWDILTTWGHDQTQPLMRYETLCALSHSVQKQCTIFSAVRFRLYRQRPLKKVGSDCCCCLRGPAVSTLWQTLCRAITDLCRYSGAYISENQAKT